MRLVFVVGGFSLSLATVILAIAACAGAEVSASLLAVTGPLAGMAGYGYVGGSKTLSATLDRIRITTTGGTDTFDAGTVAIIYE